MLNLNLYNTCLLEGTDQTPLIMLFFFSLNRCCRSCLANWDVVLMLISCMFLVSQNIYKMMIAGEKGWGSLSMRR
jgi:hypothetical protein